MIDKKEDLSFGALWRQCTECISSHPKYHALFWVVLTSLSLANFYFQKNIFHGEEMSRYGEIVHQLIQVLIIVCFMRGLHFFEEEQRLSFGDVLKDGLFLTPGYILQSIFFLLLFLVGLCLFILPGFYVGVMFFMAPIFAVLYPDYEGTLFTHTRKMVQPHWKLVLSVGLFSSLIPLIPTLLGFLYTRDFDSPFMAYLSPIDSGLFLFCQIFLFKLGIWLHQRDRSFREDLQKSSLVDSLDHEDELQESND